jgi:hypothetical protein
MTTPSKACVLGLFGSCAAAAFATCARFDVSTSMDFSLFNSFSLSRKDKSSAIRPLRDKGQWALSLDNKST